LLVQELLAAERDFCDSNLRAKSKVGALRASVASTEVLIGTCTDALQPLGANWGQH
jgi:hypothetical protein